MSDTKMGMKKITDQTYRHTRSKKPKKQRVYSTNKDTEILDTLFSEFIRRRAIQRAGGCEYCGRNEMYIYKTEDGTMTIECAHLTYKVPDDVNLIDILEYMADCITAGLARSGNIYDDTLTPDVIFLAYKNTWEKIKSMIEVVE